MKGKCLIAVTGIANSKGCGEGFSYIKVAMWGKQCLNLPILSIIQSWVTHFHLSHEGQVSNGRDRDSQSQGVQEGVLLHQGYYVGQAMF